MPKYRPETEKIKAKNLIKPLAKNNFNQTATARQLGLTPQTINEQFHRKPVQDILQRFFNSRKLKKTLIQVAKEGLAANKVISCNVIAPDGEGMKDANSMTKDFVDVPDHQARHKFWHDLAVAAGGLKGEGAKIIVGDNSKVIFQDIKIEQSAAPDLLKDINNRLSMQFNKQ